MTSISASPLLGHFYCAPGNPGIDQVARVVDLKVTDHEAIARFSKRLAAAGTPEAGRYIGNTRWSNRDSRFL